MLSSFNQWFARRGCTQASVSHTEPYKGQQVSWRSSEPFVTLATAGAHIWCTTFSEEFPKHEVISPHWPWFSLSFLHSVGRRHRSKVMNKKDLVHALCYRLRARHGRALDFEYILPVKSGDGEIPREDWVMLITMQWALFVKFGTFWFRIILHRTIPYYTEFNSI